MDAAQANLLARRARGPLTKGVQRAWPRLGAAAEAGDEHAADALREAWLRDGRDETWPYDGRMGPVVTGDARHAARKCLPAADAEVDEDLWSALTDRALSGAWRAATERGADDIALGGA